VSDISTTTPVPISTVTGEYAQRAATPERTDELDKDAFLQLLVAQLRYQNPLSPSDPNQFMAQTAQFTMVEKMEELAAHAASERAYAETMTATALLGKEITWIDAAGETHTGVVTATSFGSAGATLEVGDQDVPLDRVSGARSVGASAPALVEDTEPTDSTDDTVDPIDDTTTDSTPDATDGDMTDQTQEA
jgi:flagellar basal-body rod modification protein FlgD